MTSSGKDSDPGSIVGTQDIGAANSNDKRQVRQSQNPLRGTNTNDNERHATSPDVTLAGLVGVHVTTDDHTELIRLADLPRATQRARDSGQRDLANELDRARWVLIDARRCRS